MTYKETDENLAKAVVDVVRMMYKHPDDEEEAFTAVRGAMNEWPEQGRDSLLALALMQLGSTLLQKQQAEHNEVVFRLN